MIIENKFSITDFAVSPEITLTSNSAITQITSPAPAPTPMPMYNNYMIRPKLQLVCDDDKYYCKCQCFTLPNCPCGYNNFCNCNSHNFNNCGNTNNCPCSKNNYSYNNYHCNDSCKCCKKSECSQYKILDNKELILAIILACAIK